MLDLFIKIGYLVLGLNFVVFAMYFSNQGKAYKIFTIYIAVIGIIQIASRILSSFGMGNLFLSHFYFIAQFIILSFFYLELLKEQYQKKIIKLALLKKVPTKPNFCVMPLEYFVTFCFRTSKRKSRFSQISCAFLASYFFGRITGSRDR
mgnify:CR=1 FL=1